MSEFEKQNAEAVGVVRDGQRLPRKKCYFVSEVEYNRLMSVEAALARAEHNLHITLLTCAATAPALLAAAVFLGRMLG